MAKKSSKQSPPKTPDDKFKVIIHFSELRQAKAFVSKHGFDLVQTIEPQEKSAASLIFYLNKDQIKIAQKAYRDLEVLENISAVGRKRQKEVGAGDRFKGGKVAPRSRNLKQRGDF